jgi:hypothetical protein
MPEMRPSLLDHLHYSAGSCGTSTRRTTITGCGRAEATVGATRPQGTARTSCTSDGCRMTLHLLSPEDDEVFDDEEFDEDADDDEDAEDDEDEDDEEEETWQVRRSANGLTS